MLNSNQLRELIIKPALEDLLMYSEDAVELMLYTCANESNGGTYIKQVKGPALGIYQMEPATYADIWANFIINRNDIKLQFIHNFNAARMPSEDRMIYDLRFATAMTRIHYARVKESLPNKNDINGLWEYYKKYYNSVLGKADQRSALIKYQQFIKS